MSRFFPHPFEGGGTLTASLTYDGYGNPLTVTEPGENVFSRTTTFNYTQDGAYSQPMFVGHPLTMTDTLGHTTHFRYDARGNLTSEMDAIGIVTDTQYDVADQVASVLLPASGQTGSGRGQIVNTYAYAGGPLRFSNTLDESGAAVRTYNYAYGNEGELKTQYGSNISQTVIYDALYRRIGFQDGNGNSTTYVYDSNGRLTATLYPNANLTNGTDMERTTAFDNSGLPLQAIDGRGVVSNFAYEADGSPSGVSYPASPGENVALTRDASGQVTQRSDASGTEQFIYNYVGNLYRQITRYKAPGGALMNPFVQTIQQYRSGALYRNSTSLGNVQYFYDNAGRLTTMQDPDGASTSWSYTNNDWLTGQQLSTGTTTALTRNVLGQLTSQRHANSANTTLSSWGDPTNAAQKQLYNALGQLTRSSANGTPTFGWGGTTNYAYDNRSQLTQESSTRSIGYTNNFNYTGAGNLSVWKGVNRAYNTDNQEVNRSQPVAYAYDGAGNTTQLKNYNLASPATPNAPAVAAPTQKLVYNAQGQLAELRDANNALIASYVYRGDGKRAWKELAASGTRVYFYYMGDQLTATSNGNDVSSLQLWGADGLVGTRNVNAGVVSKFYFLYDTQGNLAQTVDASTGNVVSQSAVSAWGEPLLDANGNASGGGYSLKFGYIRDGESGFYLCTLRYYDASAGRWITRDPIGYAGGSNLYGYVGNDPVNASDPSGLSQDMGGGNGTVRFSLAAFIPQAKASFPGGIVFAGDGRGFSFNSSRFRVQQNGIINLKTGRVTFAMPQPGTTHGIGGIVAGYVGTPDFSYNHSATKNCTGKYYDVWLRGAAADPYVRDLTHGLARGLFNPAPPLSYELHIQFDLKGNVTYVGGNTTGFPAFELWTYQNGGHTKAWGYDPRAVGAGISSILSSTKVNQGVLH